VFEDSMIDADTLIVAFGVKPVTLPDVDGGQSDEAKDNHGNEARQLTQDDREEDQAEERHADGDGGKGQEAASDAHKLQRFLYAFVYRKEIFHRFLKFGRSRTY